MKLPVIQARDLVASAGFKWIDHLSTMNIEPEFVDDATKTVVLITESDNEPDYFANATFKGINAGVEVQIFYKNKVDFPIQDAEIDIQRLFVSDKWQVSISREHVYDPDTGQLTKTFYCNKTFKIRKKDK
ncbi:DUF806 family protein [Limosilactobacillus vaginalis]|uniref:DUF806 family protein n=1 Tax=Limosilactobacillus vaginalis TaxID=1633 RepID=UPI0025A4A572|nr:DUF806 family protein [Limosilactobacillus vaginalis]MDM8222014.1 DUF806 family protein [Limosilactobacillus vaginalis]